MLLLLESLAHLGPLGAPSLVEVKSVDFTDDVWGQGKESFSLQSTAHEVMDAVSTPAWLGVRAQACHPKTHFQNSAQDTCSSLIYITLTRLYSKMDLSGVQGWMF